jgi:hypothetical protein
MQTLELRYPIGKFSGEPLTAANRRTVLLDIAELPGRLRDAVEGLSDAQLDTPYRPEGWTIRQVVHHLADSHMHAYLRSKFALTQAEPTIMAYDENQWAQLKDAQSGPIEPSLVVLDGLHARWTSLLESLKESDWARTFLHPENGVRPLSLTIPIYAWHGKHHTAHITELRKRKGWG